MGQLKYHLILCRQWGQNEGGVTIDMSRGILYRHAFTKLPTIAPKKKIKTGFKHMFATPGNTLSNQIPLFLHRANPE
jgi:hypothetical protein